MKANVPIGEQETIINVFPKVVSDRAEIYSCIPTMIARIRKLADKYPDDVRIERTDDVGMFASVPYRWVKISPVRKQVYTEEQKRVIAERFAQYRAKKAGDSA